MKILEEPVIEIPIAEYQRLISAQEYTQKLQKHIQDLQYILKLQTEKIAELKERKLFTK